MYTAHMKYHGSHQITTPNKTCSASLCHTSTRYHILFMIHGSGLGGAKSALSTPEATLRMPWWNCYHTATASDYSDRAVTSPGGAFQTDTNLANRRHRTRLLADCQWRCRWRCGLGRLRNTRSLTKTIPRDRRKLIKLMLRKWTFLPPRSHLIRQFVKRHLVDITERTARSGAVAETIFLSRPWHAQCNQRPVLHTPALVLWDNTQSQTDFLPFVLPMA